MQLLICNLWMSVHFCIDWIFSLLSVYINCEKRKCMNMMQSHHVLQMFVECESNYRKALNFRKCCLFLPGLSYISGWNHQRSCFVDNLFPPAFSERTKLTSKLLLFIKYLRTEHEMWVCEECVKVSFVTRDSGQDGQTPLSVRGETVPLMIRHSSRLITPHTSVYLSPFIFSLNTSANGIKNMLPGVFCNLENKSIKFINLIMGNNNE